MTKYVISGYIGFDNFGDEAIAKVLTAYLKSKGAEKITVLSSNPSKTAQLYDVESENYLKFFYPILESDVLISGGGSLLQDVTSLKSLIYYLAVIVTALVFNKKVIIFAQGFTPFRTKFGKIFTQFVLKYCDRIYVRDIKSQKILEDMSIKSELVSDPVFQLEPLQTRKKEGLGIQLRSFFTLKEDFLSRLAKDIAIKFPEQKIKLISLQDSLDMPVIEKFASMMEKEGIEYEILKDLTVEQAIIELSQLEYLIGMRFHACLVAAKAGVKVLGINYDIKVANLADYIGFPTIELDSQKSVDKMEELINLEIQRYNLPNFEFPNL